MNRALSIRSNKTSNRGGSSLTSPTSKKGFSFASLRGSVQPELSRKLYKLIKSSNNLISAHEAAGKERVSIATQLSEWGEQTGDESVSDLSDKIGVILSEIGEQEENYGHALDDSRGVLKAIRNTEKSVQPSRDHKAKIADEIAKTKLKEPESTRIVVLEQELVRAEAENLVAEAQLTNVTREKLKEAYETEFAAVIERAEKQIILAKHGRRLLSLLDVSPVTPGDARPTYVNSSEARQILNDAEDDLRDWQPQLDDFQTAAGSDRNLVGRGQTAADSDSHLVGRGQTADDSDYAGRGQTVADNDSHLVGRGQTADDSDGHLGGRGQTVADSDSNFVGQGQTATDSDSKSVGQGHNKSVLEAAYSSLSRSLGRPVEGEEPLAG